MNWTIIASVAAAVSALFAAISAFLIWWQSVPHYKLTIKNIFNNGKPQHIFNLDNKFAIVRVELQNKSSHFVFLSDCSLKIGKNVIWALQSGTDFCFSPTITLETDYGAKIKLNADKHGDGFLKVPIELKPYEYMDKYLLFPNFTISEFSKIEARISFYSLHCHKKSKKVILYSQSINL